MSTSTSRTAAPPGRTVPSRAASHSPTAVSPGPKDTGFGPMVWAAVAVVVVAIGLWVWQPWYSPPPQAACVIAIDAQASTHQMASAYQGWLPSLVGDCAQQDQAQVTVLPVTSETITGTTQSAKTNLREDVEFSGNQVNDQRRIDAEISRFLADDVQEAIFNAPAQKRGGTDLLSLSKVTAPHQGEAGTTLIILTDAMNHKKPYRLARIPLGPEDITGYIEQLTNSGQIADLAGTSVYMYGVNTGTFTHTLSAERLSAIESFWDAYFRAAGANLVAYQRAP